MLSRTFEKSREGLKKAQDRLSEAIARYYASQYYQPPLPHYQAPIESNSPSSSPPPLAWIVKDGLRYPFQNESRLLQGNDLLILNENVPHQGLIFDVYEGDNIVIGDSQHNSIIAGNGNNIIITQNGNDTIRVGNGDNYIDAGGGKNHIHTGNGYNIYVFEDKLGKGGIQVLHNFHYENDIIFFPDLAHGMNRDGHLLNGEITLGGHLRLYFKHRYNTYHLNGMPQHELVIANFDNENGYVTLIDQNHLIDYYTLPLIPLFHYSDEL